jgi:Na+-driven multidrug efflux pump
MQVHKILKLFGQDSEVAGHAEAYVLAYIPALYMYGLYHNLEKFLTCLQKNKVPLIA